MDPGSKQIICRYFISVNSQCMYAEEGLDRTLWVCDLNELGCHSLAHLWFAD